MKNNQTEFFFYPEIKEGQNRVVIAGVLDTKTNTIKIGKSECSPKDRFCKAKGRAIALGRAKCDRPMKEKEFIQKGTIVRTNKALLPTVFSIDSETTILHQFIEIAKSL